MKHSCVVPGCHNHSENGKSISFHSFPTDETLRQIWMDWVHSLPSNSELTENIEDGHICSVHFSPEDEYVDGEEMDDDYKPRSNLSIPSIHLPEPIPSTSSAMETNEVTEEENTVDTSNHFEDNGETEPEPDTEAETEVPEPQTEDPSDEDDELPLQARIKEDRMSDFELEEEDEDEDSDPSFDPSNPKSSVIQPVTGGRGRKARAPVEPPPPAPTRPGRGRPPKNAAPRTPAPPKEPKRNKRKSQPKKVTKRPSKRELKLRSIEYDTDEEEAAAEAENNQNSSNQQTQRPSASSSSAAPEIPESIMLSLNSSNSRIVALTEEIENCHKLIKEKNEVLNKLNLNINELSSKLKYFTQSEFSIKLTSVITEASKGDTRAVYLLDQIRKYNSVAASNTVYVALPSTSAALSTAAAQSVIQEQIQQQQQQSSQRSSSSHSNHTAAHQQQHSSQQAQAQQQAAQQAQAQQQAAAAAAAQQQAVAAAAAAVNNNALYNQYQQSLAAQQLQLPFQTFTADHLAYHNQRF